MPAPGSTKTTVAALALLVATAVLYLHGLGGAPLLEPDEGRYAEIPREMLASGDWLVPHRDGFVYLQKPPLGYWLTGTAYRLLGATAGTARTGPALAAVATVGVAVWHGVHCFGPAGGLAAGLILATMPLFYFFGRLVLLDMYLTLFLTLAVVCLQRAVEDDRTRWRLGAGLAMAAAVLTKGLVGIVLPILIVLLTAIVERDASIVRRALGPAPLLPPILLPAPWFVVVEGRVPGFFTFFFWRHHLLRYAVGGKIGHHQHPWFIGAVFLAGALPWSLALVSALLRGEWRTTGRARDRQLVVWMLAIVGFYSCSRAAIATYVCPAFVPLALLAGHSWAEGWIGRGPIVVAGLVALAVLGGARIPEHQIVAFGMHHLDHRWWWPARTVVAALPATATIVLVGALIAAVLQQRGPRLIAFAATLAVAIVSAEHARSAFPSYAVLGTVAREHGAQADRLVTYGKLLEGLPFYAHRRTAIVAWTGTDDFGGGPTDARALHWSRRQLVRAWNNHRRLFLVIEPDEWFRLQRYLACPCVALASEHDRLLMTNVAGSRARELSNNS